MFGLVIILMAGFVSALAFSGRDDTASSAPFGDGVTTTRTFTPGPPQDEADYFTGMNINWESTWNKSETTGQASICDRWLADPFTLLTADSIPPDLPSNITQDTFRKRLSDFLIGKCGLPTQPSPTPAGPTFGP